MYGKMFFATGKDNISGTVSSSSENPRAIIKESVTDYVERKFKKEETKTVSMEEKEVEDEMVALDKEVDYMLSKKMKELSFEVKDTIDHYPEVDELQGVIARMVGDYKVARKLGMGEEAMK